MKFKTSTAQEDFEIAPKKLREICEDFETYSLYYGIESTVTRFREAVAGDSGVHEVGRGVDFRDSVIQPDGTTKHTYTSDQAESIVKELNVRHPRSDGKPTAMHHSFQGGPAHFHLQIPVSWLLPGEPLPRKKS